MEPLIRVLVFVVGGGLLLLANIWFVRAAFDSFDRRALVIAPIEVIGGSDSTAGTKLASLLQARLQQLQTSLQRAQESLVAARPASRATSEEPQPAANEGGRPAPPIPRFWAEPIQLNAALFQPIQISASVGGVDVGRLVPWFQRLVAQPQTLNFTVSYEEGSTLVAGDIRPLGTDTGSVWIRTTDKTPTKIADLIAHELILQQLAADSRSRFGVLDVEEFQVLSTALVDAARLNERISRGRAVKQELADLLPGLERLVEKVPHWTELIFFVGSVAEGAGARDKALAFYARLDPALGAAPVPGGTQRVAVAAKVHECRRRLNFDPPCRLNFDPGMGAGIVDADCG